MLSFCKEITIQQEFPKHILTLIAKIKQMGGVFYFPFHVKRRSALDGKYGKAVFQDVW
jgi:hypothetical protein